VPWFRVEADGDELSVVLRPELDGRGPLSATMDGLVAAQGDPPTSVLGGSVQVHVVDTDRPLVFDVRTTRPELDVDGDGVLLLRGSATRPATSLGLTAPPLVNPTVVLRWRARLLPTDA
jgi:hypothetical protein